MRSISARLRHLEDQLPILMVRRIGRLYFLPLRNELIHLQAVKVRIAIRVDVAKQVKNSTSPGQGKIEDRVCFDNRLSAFVLQCSAYSHCSSSRRYVPYIAIKAC